MPAPEKAKKSKKLDKGKKGEFAKKKKASSGNLMLILSVVGVVVLIAVGITIFFLMSGGEKPIAKSTGLTSAQQLASEETRRSEAQAAQGGGAAANAPNIEELAAKANDMIDKLADSTKKDEASKQLREMLDSDLVNKAPGGRNALLMAIVTKAKAGNEAAAQFMRELARDTSNASLAQSARKAYDENLRKEGETDIAAQVDAGEEPTNFIPNKADALFSMQVAKFLESDFNRGVFTTGAFRQEDVQKRLGIPANTIEQFIVSGIKDFSQVAAVIRTTNPMNWDDVKKTLHIEEAGTTIKGKTYYIGKVDFMTEFLGQRMPGIEALRDKAAFWRVDSRTLVYADETTMKDLLENPPEKGKSLEPPPSAGLPGGRSAGAGTGGSGGVGLVGADGGSGGGGGGGAVGLAGADGGSQGGRGAPGTVGAAGGGAGGAAFSNQRGGSSSVGGGGGAASALDDPSGGAAGGQPGAAGGDQTGRAAAGSSEHYLTIDPRLRRLIRLTEDSKQTTLVLFADKATTKVPVLINYVQYLDKMPATKGREIEALAFVLPATTGSPSLRLGVACKGRGVVRDVSAEIEKILARIGKEELNDLFGFEFKMTQAQGDTQASTGGLGAPGAGSGAGIGGGGGKGLGIIGSSGGDTGGSAFQSNSRGGNRGGGVGGGVGAGLDGPGGAGGIGAVGSGGGGARGGRGGAGLGVPGGSGGGVGGGLASLGSGEPGGGAPGTGQPGAGTDAADQAAGGQFTVERSDEYIIITASMKSSLTEFIDKHMKSWMQQIRGNQEMASGKFRFGDLTSSLEYYKSDLTRNNRPIVYPFGAYPRTFDAERGPRPYPAHERISFLRELLPYLGDDRYFGMQRDIDPERSWREGSNLTYARILVPHFLNPAAGPSSNYVKARGVDQAVAATHFVGMAGVGPDAAYLPKTDPRAGIFGYDRQASPDDVKDGLSNTIFMIEADKALLGPWLQGGGATVRGTSIDGKDVGRRGGFSSPNFSGKAGVWVMMADGSARFLAKDISPDVFKALCTMAGSDSAGAIDLIATKHSLEVTPRTEQQTAVSTGKRKKIVEEEEVPVKK